MEGSVKFGDKNYLNHLHQAQMYAFLARRLRAKAAKCRPRTENRWGIVADVHSCPRLG